MLLDKNGVELYVGAEVEVPTPTSEDDWNFEFVGTIKKLDKVNGCVVVEDMDGFCQVVVESGRLEIL